jgi:hypothetical protein
VGWKFYWKKLDVNVLVYHGNVDAYAYVTSAAFAQVCLGSAHPVDAEIVNL